MTDAPVTLPSRGVSRRAVLVGIAAVAVSASCARSRSGSVPPSSTTAASPTVPPSTMPPSAVPPASVPPASVYVPEGEGWATVDAAGAGWDPVALDAAAGFALERSSAALLVLLDGRILLERMWAGEGYRRDIASAQKSIVSTLAGIAHERGEIDLDAPVTRYLGPGWSFAPAADEEQIAVHHLLTMTTGLDDDLQRVSAPGETWHYNNTTYHLVRLVVEQASGLGVEALTRSRLWDPIGVSADSAWQPRPGRGRFSVDPTRRPLWGLTITPRDLARFGLLVQRNGRWATASVVGEAELDRALQPSSPMNPAYGELWWLNGQESFQLPQRPSQPGPLLPSAPSDVVAALGKDDQKLYVSRSTGLVVVRLGERAAETALSLSSFDDELWKRLLAASP